MELKYGLRFLKAEFTVLGDLFLLKGDKLDNFKDGGVNCLILLFCKYSCEFSLFLKSELQNKLSL